MNFKDKTLKIKGGIVGAIVLPLAYIISLLVTQDPDFILSKLGLFGISLFIVQWISFLFGGWVLAIISTIIFFSGVGFLLGMLVGIIIDRIKSKNKKSCSPFKVWGGYIGGIIGGLVGFRLSIESKLSGCQVEMGSLGCTATLEEKLIGILIGIIFGFLICWGIHSLIKKIKK